MTRAHDEPTREELLAEIEQLRVENTRLLELVQDKQERFEAFMEHSPVIAFIKDADGRLQYVNRRYIDVFELHDRGWFDKADHELWRPETAAILRANDVAVLQQGDPVAVEEPVQLDDGTHYWLSFKFPFKDVQGNQYLGGTAVEITEIKNLQRELQEAKDAAELAVRAKSQFLANMSHEIRTPMHGILGAGALLASMALEPDARECAKIVHRSSRALLTILDDIIDIARIESGGLSIEPARFDLQELVQDVWSLLVSQAEGKRLLFELDIDELGERWLTGDTDRIRQILFNLISNAIKFTATGRIDLRCRSRLGEDGRVEIELEVEDTGIGIAASQLEEIFHYFTQADISSTRKVGGAGLGLPLSQHLARLMGGELTCSSELGQGSRFVLSLQLERDEATHTGEFLAVESKQERHYQKRVLLVEDNRINRLIARQMLDKLGVIIDVAENGHDAVDRLQHAAFDLVLMDLHMPIMDGIQATRRIRGLPGAATTPIVALTADALPETRTMCMEAGMNGYLTKPIAAEKLIAELDRWLH